MKKLIPILSFLLIATSAFAQGQNPTATATYKQTATPTFTPPPTQTPGPTSTPLPSPVILPHKWIGLTDNQGHTAVINPDGTLPFSTTGAGTNPIGPAGGVLGGTYPNPLFNSTNTAGNLINNAFIINNANAQGGSVELEIGDAANHGGIINFDASSINPPIEAHYPHMAIESFSTDGVPAHGAESDWQVDGADNDHVSGLECDTSDYTGDPIIGPTSFPGYCYTAGGAGTTTTQLGFITNGEHVINNANGMGPGADLFIGDAAVGATQIWTDYSGNSPPAYPSGATHTQYGWFEGGAGDVADPSKGSETDWGTGSDISGTKTETGVECDTLNRATGSQGPTVFPGECYEFSGTPTGPPWPLGTHRAATFNAGMTAIAGTINIYGGTSGHASLVVPSAAATPTLTLPTTTGTLALTSQLPASPLPIASGGTGTASTLSGLVRGSASAMTAAELSGDCTTSGSNAVTCTKINGTTSGTLFAAGTISATDSATVGCTDTTGTVASATTTMTCHASPQGAPSGTGSGNIIWGCYTTAGHVVLRVCTIVVVTGAATTYNYEIFN